MGLRLMLVFAIAFFIYTPPNPALSAGKQIPDNWLEPAAKIVSRLETSKAEGWNAITPDFDCQGLSAGVLQWNIGKGSLWNRILSKISANSFKSNMPTYGDQFRQSFLPNAEVGALEFVRALQSYKDKANCANGNVRGAAWTLAGEKFAQELVALMTSDGLALQRAAVRAKLQEAWDYATWWATDKRGKDATPTFTELVFFMDTLTFNGVWKKQANYRLVKDFRAGKTRAIALREITSYLASAVPDQLQRDEAKKNSDLWMERSITDDQLDLLVFSYLIAKAITKPAATQFRLNTISRRGTIVLNDGYVNGERMKFDHP